jgi:hypothetical protein
VKFLSNQQKEEKSFAKIVMLKEKESNSLN